MSDRTCTIEGCERDVCVIERGLCRMHYLRWWRTGDPGPAELAWQFNPPECTIDGCKGDAIKRGWCSMHYQRWRKHGDTGSADPMINPNPPECTVDGCGRAPKVKGLCQAHYARVRYSGSPGTAEIRPVVIGDQLGYQGIHRRVRLARGLASEHVCECGESAAEWSYDHDDPDELIDPRIGSPYSLDIEHYQPMCRSCHRTFDLAKSEAA